MPGMVVGRKVLMLILIGATQDQFGQKTYVDQSNVALRRFSGLIKNRAVPGSVDNHKSNVLK